MEQRCRGALGTAALQGRAWDSGAGMHIALHDKVPCPGVAIGGGQGEAGDALRL